MGNKPSGSSLYCDPREQSASAGKPASRPSLLPSIKPAPSAGAGHECSTHYRPGKFFPGHSHESAAAAAALPASESIYAPDLALIDAFKNSGLPTGVIALAAGYLHSVEYDKFQQEGVVPKKETGMLVLSRAEFDFVPGNHKYNERIGNQPGFELPSTRETFSFHTRAQTITAILRLLSPSVPWSVTVLTIILYSETLPQDWEDLAAILPAIATALERVKHLVLVIGSAKYVFNVGEYDSKPSSTEIGVKNVTVFQNILNTFSQFPTGSILERCQYMLSHFPRSESLSNELHSIDLPLDIKDKDHLAFCQTLAAADPAIPVDSRLKIAVAMDPDFMRIPENAKLFPYFSYVSIEFNTVPEGLYPLDFSKFERMVSLIVNYCGGVGHINLPLNKSNLEKIDLDVNRYEGGLTFIDSEPYPRLRDIYLRTFPSDSPTIRLDSKMFPALERVNCETSFDGTMLDLSGIEKPGLNLALTQYRGRLILPTVALGQLRIGSVSLGFPEILAALPRAHDLYFEAPNPEDFKRLFRILQRTGKVARDRAAVGAVAGAGSGDSAAAGERKVVRASGTVARKYTKLSITSNVLERLTLQSYDGVDFGMGPFLHLQSLELYGIVTVLEGCNFPLLRSLYLRGGNDIQVVGNFPSLFSLKLKMATDETVVQCTAPKLRELECIEAENASNVMIGPLVFPRLRSLVITTYDEIMFSTSLPTFASDVSPIWSRAITVRLGALSDSPSCLLTLVEIVGRALPECLILSSNDPKPYLF